MARTAWAETSSQGPPSRQPVALPMAPDAALRACEAAALRMGWLEVAEVDPRRGVLEAWVRLLPVRAPRLPGLGWTRWFDPHRAAGWLQVRVDPLEGGKAQVGAHVRIEHPLAGFLAGRVLARYLAMVRQEAENRGRR